MQTFFAFSSFSKTAGVLDTARLGKQRLEAWQILNNLLGIKEMYPHHPVMPMWLDYEHALVCYGIQTCTEWIRRGFKDDMMQRFAGIGKALRDQGFPVELPPWWRDADLMRSHRSNLFRKDPVVYAQFSPRRGTPADMPYLWPTPLADGGYELRVSLADGKRLRSGERTLPTHLAGLA